MDLSKLKVGDKVKLKEGGGYSTAVPNQIITVEKVTSNGVLSCFELTGGGKAQGVFFARELEAVETKETTVTEEETTVTEEETTVTEDVVSKPSHYTRWSIEPITFIMRNGMEFWRGNIIKYACRAGFKLYDGHDSVESEITDLQKVIRYAEMRINQISGETEL